MNLVFLTKAARENWHLLLVLLICAGLFGYKVAFANDPAVAGTPQQAGATDERHTAADALGAIQEQRRPEKYRVLALIAQYETELHDDPKAEDAPARLSAMGNLYRQKLGDYHQAARCYELLLLDYPEWSGLPAIYVQLTTCYERTGQLDEASRVYRKMLDVFPEDTQEHQYAKAKLHGEI